MSAEVFEERNYHEGPKAELRIYNSYLKNLGITPDDLRNKRILDVGAERRYFAAHVLRENLTDQIFSLDPKVSPRSEDEKLWKEIDEEMQEQVHIRTVKARGQAIPLKDESVDFVLANCFPRSKHSGCFEEAVLLRKEIEDLFEEFMRVLAPGGELRYYAIRRYDEPWRDPQALNWRRGIMAKLAELKKKGFEVTVEEADRGQQKDGSWTFWDRIILRKPGK